MNSFNLLLTKKSYRTIFAKTVMVIAFGFGLVSSNGQAVDSLSAKHSTGSHIAKLKEGVLVVRLSTNHNAISALESTLKTTELKPKMRATLEEQLAEKKHERDSVNNALFQAFGHGVYDFSEVVFMYDTSTTSFQNRKLSGYFYNKNGEPDPGFSLEGRDYYLIYIGRTDQSTSTNTKAFVVCDKYLNPLERPFPAYITFKSLLSKSKAGKKKKKAKGLFKGFKIEEIVEKVDGTFEWFYKESQ